MAPGTIEVGPASGPDVTLTPQAKSVAPPVPQDAHDPAHEEHQYLNLIRDILDSGEHRPDRTGTGTYSLFAPQALRFTLSRPSASDPTQLELLLPLLTTKRVFTRAVIAELLWFVEGCTSSVPLAEQNVHIWDGNGSRAFLDSVGLSHRNEGDLGPVYGFQWRHFGAEYVDAETDYAGQGVDQLAEVVRKLREAPFDRRIIMSAWNPADLKKMALPPCHMFAQFYVSFPSKCRRSAASAPVTRPNGANTSAQPAEVAGKEKGVLHTILYQRSNDMGLGVPFNIASYALLTHMLAHACNLVPGTLTHNMGDAHIYLDHVSALEEQLTREPRPFPTLKLPEVRRAAAEQDGVKSMEGWKVEDFVIEGYKPHKAVAMKMSV
ncbi:hypothetical protein FH972_023748 [Carpinus fangiana]|uniref:thymidylate synthase n=1 Tax=Carpinus fangiana TaxID=176857 RepID=A0A5N6KWV8_9ROSI|nr:hypothetical protein FH972_023748 [Carpinus fangiana]